jgi:hypothetical protein
VGYLQQEPQLTPGNTVGQEIELVSAAVSLTPTNTTATTIISTTSLRQNGCSAREAPCQTEVLVGSVWLTRPPSTLTSQAVAETRALLKEYEDVSKQMSAAGLSAEDQEKLSGRMDRLQTEIEAKSGWWAALCVCVCVCVLRPRSHAMHGQLDPSTADVCTVLCVCHRELDRMLDRAMDALRCPPPDAVVDTLSGGGWLPP